MKTLKQKPEIRFGLWEAYKKQCAVCGDPIEYKQMEIDHILAESLEKNEKELKNVFRIYELSNDFNLNSLYNLRPACSRCNGKKSNNMASKEVTDGLLKKAKRLKKDVERISKKFLDESAYALKIEAMRKAVLDGEINLENYVDQVNNFIADYGEDYVRVENHLNNYCSINCVSVKLDGNLPTVAEPKGNCVFTFNSFYIRGTVISMSHEEILRTLYLGFETPIEFQLRPYIIANINEETFMVQIGSCRFNLNREEVNHLCKVVDKFLNEYLQAIDKIDVALSCRNYFPLKEEISKYRLINVSTDLWNMMLRFAREHDYEAGNSSWHIFDASGRNMIKVFNKYPTDRYNSGFHCFVHSLADSDYSWNPSNHVWLIWWNVENKDSFSIRESWSVNQTYNWFVDEFIPMVMYKYNTPTRLFRKKISFEKFKKKINFNDLFYRKDNRYYDLDNIINPDDLLKLISDLQLHFSYDFYCEKKFIAGCYDALLYILSLSSKTDFHYICTNLNIKFTTNIEDLILSINIKKNSEVNDSKRNLDRVFRSIFGAVNFVKDTINRDEIMSIGEHLETLVVLYNRDKKVEAYCGRQ